MIKTFRGVIASGGQEEIKLGTIKGQMGYQVIKFQLLETEPGEANVEHTVKIFKTKQTTINNTIDFSDTSLIAAGVYLKTAESAPLSGWNVVIFDSEIFNQDIFITHSENVAAVAVNYYIELDRIALSELGAEYTTIKDIRTAFTSAIV